MITDQKRRLDAQLERAFDAVAKRAGNTLVFNGRKAVCVATPISYEEIQQIVGFLPRRWADVEITRTAFNKLGCTNENYVALDGVVLRIKKRSGDDVGDPFVHLVLHSTPNQPAAATQESGSVALAIDQVEVPLTFLQVNPASDHVFTTLYVENTVDANPIATFDPVPSVRLSGGRKIMLAAAPDTANYVLRWSVST